ncbi:hypothetical protein [Cuneatibacter caecimuris]|uniref:Uncharacterized protein n=1 Tax=Cuneatibacter caecimuris TaxID=1796618 RepID=A0A4Q7PPB0_9FIRM|nr:hypothetical protein [Cuneatibacter caecimuris]RZT02116.1 hypothetical protein EV209_0221 [Cuneatibacter caecimuris]
MTLKESFRDSINRETVVDEAFCMKLYGFSLYDPQYFEEVKFICEALYDLLFEKYEGWCQKYDDKTRQTMLEVGAWYRKRLEEEQERKKVMSRNGQSRRERNRFAGFPEDW